MNKVALVTGGSRGIGFGISQSFAREGIDLAICGVRPEDDVLETVNELRKSGIEVKYYQADISNKTARRKLIKNIKKHF